MSKLFVRPRNAGFKLAHKILDTLENTFSEQSIEVLVDEELEKRIEQSRKTVLYIGIKYDYGAKNLGLSYEHHNFFSTIKNMNFNYIYFDYDRIKQQFGPKKMNFMLRETILYYQPDYIFYFHYKDWIDHELLRELSELPSRSIIWLADDHWRYEETRPIWELFDVIATTDQVGYDKRKKDGYNNVFQTQWGCNHFIYRKIADERPLEVVFIGRNYGERQSFVDVLRSQGIKVECYGEGWENSGRVTQADLIHIYNRSKISLNLSLASKSGFLQIKGRDFEAPGCGSLLLTKYSKGIEEYFIPGKEIVTYVDEKDAADKIRYYLKNEHERELIAEAGYIRVKKDHTIEKRILDLFAFSESLIKKT